MIAGHEADYWGHGLSHDGTWLLFLGEVLFHFNVGVTGVVYDEMGGFRGGFRLYFEDVGAFDDVEETGIASVVSL